jgi:hypothetical protein
MNVNSKKNKRFFMITISLALIVAGILAVLSLVKAGGINGKACALNDSVSAACTTGSTITGGVIGTLQSGGIITGIVALFVVALGAVILISTMRSSE